MAGGPQPHKIPLVFYCSEPGREPVREWLQELAPVERQAIGQDLLRAQWRWPVGMPLCKPLSGGLWEIRTDLPTRRTARVLICVQREHLFAEAMKERKISKNKMAILLKTSRTQVDRLLDSRNDITLSSLQRAAAMVGRRVSIELV